MVTILAGIDGSGKSTAFGILQDRIKKAVFVKESYPGPGTKKRIMRAQVIMNYLSAGNLVDVLYDRATLLDDFIYEPVVQKRLSVYNSASLIGLVRHTLGQCCIIYLDCNMEVLKERLQKRGDEYVNADQLEELQATYERFFPNNGIKYHRIDVTNMTPDEVADSIEYIMLEARQSYVKAKPSKKRMKLAHIVPKSCLELTADNQYHMCLAHLVLEDKSYANFYRRMSDEGRFVLMDNGAAEDAQLSLKDLIRCYDIVQPTEMVLPDTLFYGEETVAKAKNAIEYLRERGVACRFMAVPQGHNLQEWAESAVKLLQLEDVKAIGVSKFLTIITKNPLVRYQATEILSTFINVFNRPDIEVHLLGCDVGPAEVADIHADFDFVRGCDTALGYICTQAGVAMESSTSRPLGEIDFLGGIVDQLALVETLNAFDDIVGVVNTVGDKSWNN